MLDGHVLVPHLLCLVLGMNQDIVQILPDIHLPALHLGALRESLLHAVRKQRPLDSHLLQQF